MKKRFVAPVLRLEATLERLTLGLDPISCLPLCDFFDGD
jgi:hypothetical protein